MKTLLDSKLGILTTNMSQANLKPLKNLVDILEAVSDNLIIIEVLNDIIDNYKSDYKETTKIINMTHHQSKFFIPRVINFVFNQLLISYYIITSTKNVDIWFFNMGELLILPMITAWLLRKKTIVIIGGYLDKEVEFRHISIISTLLKSVKKLVLNLSSRILLYSPSLVDVWGLENYSDKIIIAHRHFLDLNKFNIDIPFEKRNNIIGLIGRLSEEKGINNYIQAIEKLENNKYFKKEDLCYLIVGSGPLYEKTYNHAQKLSSNIQFVSWVANDELPYYLNQLKLLIIPSFTEGLSNIMIEAMACGTPVLSNSVGGIPDIIKNCETGFLMNNNDPETIMQKIIEVSNFEDMDKVIYNANQLIKNEFIFKICVDNYKNFLNDFI